MSRLRTGPGTGLTEKWRQKLMTIRRSRRTLSYLLFAPSNKLVWTDEGLRKFMFFSPILSEPITVSRDTRETSNPWNEQDGGIIDRACCHVAFNRSARQCSLLDSRKFKTYSRLDITSFYAWEPLMNSTGSVKSDYVLNSTFSLQSEILPNKIDAT